MFNSCPKRSPPVTRLQEAALTPEQHHHIGKSENIYVEVGAFLRNNVDDPATKVSEVGDVCSYR